MKKILVTGAFGFVASQFIDYLFKNTDWEIVGLDKMNYAADKNRVYQLDSYESNRDRFSEVWWDLRSPVNDYTKNRIGKVNYIAHLGANSSVEDTIKCPLNAVLDNTVGTVNLLDYAREMEGLELFNYFSTDETLGPAPEGINFTEDAKHRPSNPYAAGKAGGEDFVWAYYITYNLPVFITRTMNVFGPNQHKEKFIPTVIRKTLTGESLPVYSNKEKTKAGSRFWVHGEDVASALYFLFTGKAKPGEFYHIVGTEMDNLDLAKMIAEIVGKPLNYEMQNWHESRPGHDLRYGMDGSKMKQLGWESHNIKERIKQVVESYLNKKDWM